MKPTIEARQERPLLKYAVSKLNPDIFYHPVWLRFGYQNASRTQGFTADLLRAVERLEKEDPSSACQILLLCAAFQKQAHQCYDALRTIQRALSLAEETNLAKETIWSIWGACSISIQLGNYEQAESCLLDLQSALNKQNEWILADLIDVLGQTLQQSLRINSKKQFWPSNEESLEDLFAFGSDWLQNWGEPIRIPEPVPSKPVMETAGPAAARSTILQSFFSFQYWQVKWHSLLLAIRGEFKIQWGENYYDPKKNRIFFRRSTPKPFHIYRIGPDSNSSMEEEPIPERNFPLLPPIKKGVTPTTTPRNRKLVPRKQKKLSKHHTEPVTIAIAAAVHMLGPFSLTIEDETTNLPTSRGLSVLKYLLLHHKQNIPREVLMEVFWPDAELETARNSLNVAMHNLRKALRAVLQQPIIVYQYGAYSLDPSLQVWLDVDEFEKCIKAGQHFESRDQLKAAVAQYESAISLYQGDLLEQNPYEEWIIQDRERLRVAYLDTVERMSQIYFHQENYAACITVCQRILSYDPCREDAYCLLMRCYSRQGQDHLALRQYQNCVKALHNELDVEPAPETTQLYSRIRRHEAI